MAESPPTGSDAVLQALAQIQSSVQRMDRVVNGLVRSVSTMETKLARLQRAILRDDSVPEPLPPVPTNADEDKRMLYLRNRTSVKFESKSAKKCLL